uniref:tRNA/rRNA methyltransferase SpoU type domain-containing protein n=2 Tax=Ditylum brightwellii TaxID=49249 RepID=A0A7S4SU54_9STRA
MRNLADETFTLPMVGFAESFNLSVATAVTLAHMSASSRQKEVEGGETIVTGPLRPGDLDEHEFNCLRLKGLLNSLPQRRTGPALLKQKGIVLPDDIKFL